MNCSLQSLKDSLYKALATEQNVSEQPPPPDESSRVKKSVKIGPKNIPLKPTRHPEDPFIGKLQALPSNVIPTLAEAFSACLYYKDQTAYHEQRNLVKVSDGECISKTVDQLTDNLYSFSLVPKSKRHK